MAVDVTEKRFERDIEAFLISAEGGYEQFNGQDAEGAWVHARRHDVDKCIYMDVLCEFIAKTQPEAWRKYKKIHGGQAESNLYQRIEKTISQEGLLYVLRHGVEGIGGKLDLCYFRPESGLNRTATERYKANILGCTRQFRYTSANTNTIDMVLSLNGIPIVAIELKNQLTGQSCRNAIRQYQEDRNSKEFPFRLDHRFLVYFAVDLEEAWMTTELKDGGTVFLPFNRGSNGAGMTGGAGNPAVEGDYATSYLWKEVLQRDSLLELVQKFICRTEKEVETTAKNGTTGKKSVAGLLFPRYHQYDVVRKLLADAKQRGAGHNYLIQHSAGSGKSNSIAWLTYRLASLHDAEDGSVFDTVIVVTNRVVLDNQLQKTIESFEHQQGLVESINDEKNSRSLAEAINSNRRIIICTIQKFLFAWKDMDTYRGRKFAIVVDEAHQGQNGETARVLRRSLIDLGIAVREYAQEHDMDESEVDVTDEYISALLGQGRHANQSFFAFTATPKPRTLEAFGTQYGQDENGAPLRRPFHVYSMRQAIEEGYILNVLENYTTMQEAFRLVRTGAENPEVLQGRAAQALFKYYKAHGFTIQQKTEVMMANFLENGRYRIHGQGKAMVVADSRANAVRYYFAIRKYISQHATECAGVRPLVAFSGEVGLEEYPTGTVYTEGELNVDANGRHIRTDQAFRAAFHSPQFNILVVANKYQTGFDEPLLHTMFVDKKLRDVAAVQTLSRLNRTAPGKTDTFVLDFENTAEEIKAAFLPYYEKTELQGQTDFDDVYDIRRQVRKTGLYGDTEVERYRELLDGLGKKSGNEGAPAQIAAMLKPVVDKYRALPEDDRYKAREWMRKFNRIYGYVTQMLRLDDRQLFNEYLYLQRLEHLLPAADEGPVHIDDKVRLEYAALKETFRGAVLIHEKPPVLTPPGKKATRTPDRKKTPLQEIIDKVNERFQGTFTEAHRVIVAGISDRFFKDPEMARYKRYAKANNKELFVKSLFPDKFRQLLAQCYLESNAAYEKLYSDPQFCEQIVGILGDTLYDALRRDRTLTGAAIPESPAYEQEEETSAFEAAEDDADYGGK